MLFASCGSFEQATVYRADNAGGATSEADWTAVLSDPGMGRTSLALAASNQDYIYALAASNLPGPGGNYEQGLHAVFRSTSGGDAGTWEARVRNTSATKLSTILLTNPWAATNSDCDLGTDDYTSMGWYTNVIAVDPVNPERIWAAGVIWFRSDDGGATWGLVSYNSRDAGQYYAHSDQHAMVFHPDYDGGRNQTVLIGTDGGIFRSDNALAAGATGPTATCVTTTFSAVEWRDLNNGFGITQFYHGVVFPDGDRYLGGTQDNGTLLGDDAKGFDRWEHILGGDGSYSAIDPTDPDVIYAQTQWGYVYKSTDGGEDFTLSIDGLDRARTDLLGTDANYVFIVPLMMDPSDSKRLWIGGERLFRTDNGARRWNTASRKLKRREKVSALAVSQSDSDRVLVGTNQGRVYRNTSATTAAADTKWRSKRPRKGWVTWVTHDPQDPDTVYASYGWFGGGHVWRSTNGGRRWTNIDGVGTTGLPDIPVHCVLVDPRDSQRIYLDTDLGVIVSVDGGATWAVENTGYGNIVTESLSLHTEGDGDVYLYAFTHGRGAWRVKVTR